MNNTRTFMDHYKELAEISGESVETVKKVLSAETKVAISRLKEGKDISLPGRCRMEAKSRRLIGVGKVLKHKLYATSKVSQRIQDELALIEGYEPKDTTEENLNKYVRVECIQDFM